MFTPDDVSYVMRHMSHNTFYLIFCFVFDKLVKLVGGGSVINGAHVRIFGRPAGNLLERLMKQKLEFEDAIHTWFET